LIQIQTRQLASDGSNTTPFFRISNLQFSVHESHIKNHLTDNPDGFSAPQQLQQRRRILCANLDFSLGEGEIGIVSGPSGSGKSSLLRVLCGLTPMDNGDVIMSGISLAGCFGLDGHIKSNGMIRWRTAARYVTQYKVDIPGTPRQFIHRIAEYCSANNVNGREFGTPSADVMVSSTISYLQQWGMSTHSGSDVHYSHSISSDGNEQNHHYLDKEWKQLSGGESQRSKSSLKM